MADEDKKSLNDAIRELEAARDDVTIFGEESGWASLIKAAEDILKIAGAK